MEKNKIKKLSKKELLEIMLNQAKKIKELENELDKTKTKLNSKKISIDESGSLAEASLKLNNVFETAQLAIEQYKYNIEEQCKKMTLETKKECKIEKEKIISESLEKCKKKEKILDDKIIKLDEKLSKVDKKIIELKLKEKKLQKKEKEISKIKSSDVKNKSSEIKVNKKNNETIKIKKVKTSIKDKELKIKKVNVSDLKHTINQKEVKV